MSAMCLILFAYLPTPGQAKPGLSLVLAANRDEFFARPTRAAEFWQLPDSRGQLLAGKDLAGGGTWMGITTTGRFTAVTNIRDPSRSTVSPRSRGQLTVDFLQGTTSPSAYLASLGERLGEFAGFNLLVGDASGLYYLNSDNGAVHALTAGIYGLSNGRLDDPWPKVRLGKLRLAETLSQPAASLSTDALLNLMMNREPAPDHELPSTGVPLEMERQLSASFIANPQRQYGTRCSTALIVSGDGKVRFSEQNYDSDGQVSSRHHFDFPLLENQLVRDVRKSLSTPAL